MVAFGGSVVQLLSTVSDPQSNHAASHQRLHRMQRRCLRKTASDRLGICACERIHGIGSKACGTSGDKAKLPVSHRVEIC